MIRMYWKKKCAEYFSQWRQHRYQQICHKTTFTLNTVDKLELNHKNYLTVVSDFNCKRSEKIVV